MDFPVPLSSLVAMVSLQAFWSPQGLLGISGGTVRASSEQSDLVPAAAEETRAGCGLGWNLNYL